MNFLSNGNIVGRLNAVFYLSKERLAEPQTLINKLQKDQVAETLERYLPEVEDEDQPTMKVKIDLRSGVNMPLNVATAHR